MVPEVGSSYVVHPASLVSDCPGVPAPGVCGVSVSLSSGSSGAGLLGVGLGVGLGLGTRGGSGAAGGVGLGTPTLWSNRYMNAAIALRAMFQCGRYVRSEDQPVEICSFASQVISL